MKKQNYQIYALITIFFWSMAFIFTRMTLPYFSASSLGFLRYLIASAALIVIVLVTKMKPPQLKDCPLFLLSGAIGFFLYMITFNQGLVSVPAATASVVNATVPAVTALIAGVVYKEKIRKVQWIAILIELVGVAVLTVMSGGLSAALSLSTYNILQRKLTQTYTALQASTFSIFFGTLLLAIFAPTAMRELAAAPPIQYAYVAFLGIFPSAIAYVSWSVAFAKAERTSQVSNFMVLVLFFTSILGILILGEALNPATLCGGGITLAGVLLFNHESQ